MNLSSPKDDDDDGDDRQVICGSDGATIANITQTLINSRTDHRDFHSVLPLPSSSLLLKSRIHAGGVPVAHELARGVPGFWGPPATEVSRLYAALTEVQA